MFTGMMWFDNDPKKSLDQKVAEAAKYYYEKYGILGKVCLVNAKMLPEGETNVNFIAIKPSRSVLPGHLWIGNDEVKHVDKSLRD